MLDLGAASVLVEPYYFDRDYLAEFAAYYGECAIGYNNVCKRIHFFCTPALSAQALKGLFELALGGGDEGAAAHSKLQQAYLGFVVRRPVPSAPFGRTVLSWYPEKPLDDRPPRAQNTLRNYEVHVAGLAFVVTGVAWQQQDARVSACATVALWSLLHAAAFTERHAIPTTVSITTKALDDAAVSRRAFPSSGLSTDQIANAIDRLGLSPVICDGDVRNESNGSEIRGFTAERFAFLVIYYVRSGVPLVLVGDLYSAPKSGVLSRLGNRGLLPEQIVAQHAMCALGFRSNGAETGVEYPAIAGFPIKYIYAHDDNIGPSVRYRTEETRVSGCKKRVVRLWHSAPEPRVDRVADGMPTNGPIFVPTGILAAVYDEVKVPATILHQQALFLAARFSWGIAPSKLEVSVKFIRVSDYLANDLESIVPSGDRLMTVRRYLQEDVAPMSLFVAVVRIGVGAKPLFDVLYDTTDGGADSDRSINDFDRVQDDFLNVFAHVVFFREADEVLKRLTDAGNVDLGVRIAAFAP